LKFSYKPKPVETTVPLLSIDGGMANLFVGSVCETCLIKVAVASPPDHMKWFSSNDLIEVFFHTFVGKLNQAPTDEETESRAKEEITRLLEVEVVTLMLDSLSLEKETISSALLKLIRGLKDKTALKDTVRELLEWACIFYVVKIQLEKSNSEFPYLIIKDGNLGSAAKAVSGILQEKIHQYLSGQNQKLGIPWIVGVVKSSRYTGDSPIGTIVNRVAAKVSTHSFFRLPPKYEVIMDKRFAENPFKRFFAKIINNVYEIQIPRVLAENESHLAKVLDILASQMSFAYDGSISTNSYAHIKASLSEAEARVLEQKLKNEILKESE